MSQALICPCLLCFAFWPQDGTSPHALVHFIRKHRPHRTTGLSLRKGMADKFKTTGFRREADRPEARCPDIFEHTLSLYEQRTEPCYLGKEMIRNWEDFSPLNLMKIGNETFGKSRTKVYLLHVLLFHSSKYLLNIISREKGASSS